MRNLPRAVIIMIVFLVLLGVGIWLVLAARQSGSQSGPPPSAPNPQAAAEQALETFRQIVTSENYEALGFQTPDEVKIAQLGEPLKVLRVPLNQLLSFSPDRNPEDLLVDESRVIYPITVNEQVRSSIAVEGTDQQWTATDFGNPKLITSLAQFQQEPSDFIVQIPAFSLYFIARRSDNVLLLTPIVDDARFGFKTGGTLTATQAFEAILPFAKEYNGLPDG
jgi:hypothetical protein